MCTYVLTFAEAMKNVVQCVNHIRVRGLNHRQVKAIMEYLNCDYPDVVYFTVDRLFSRAATLKGLWNMRLEVKLFMESKQQNVAFLGDENWLNDLAFFSHYTAPVRTELETTMEKSACEHICSLEKNGTVQVPFGRATLANFACLAARKMEFPDLESTNYEASIQKLRNEFTSRFPEFRRDQSKVVRSSF